VVATYHTLFEEYLQHYAPFLPPAGCAGWPGASRGASATRSMRWSCRRRPWPAAGGYGVTTPMESCPPASAGAFLGATAAPSASATASAPTARWRSTGRVAHEKNIGFLIEAFAEAIRHCPDALLLVTGEGPAMDDLRRQATRLGLEASVRFLGYLDRERDLPDCYAAATLFVFASRTETQGLVLIEALAAGTPVVALAAMGTADILADAPGCIAAPDEPGAFGRIVGTLLADPPACLALAEQAPITAAGWSDMAMAGRLADFYRKTLARHPAHRRVVQPRRARKPCPEHPPKPESPSKPGGALR
jgi:glycosyltransferase involved in cell wall biosynthesis